jgi:hypothetical protein
MTFARSRRNRNQSQCPGHGLLGHWVPFWSEDTPLGWGKVDDQEALLALQRAMDLGITLRLLW